MPTLLPRALVCSVALAGALTCAAAAACAQDGAKAAGAAPANARESGTAPTPVAVPDTKSGISLEVLGEYGKDYLVERWYHDERIDGRCTVFLRADVPLCLFHNAQNVMNAGAVVGADGGGIIRYRVDQDMTLRAKWAEFPRLYPAYEKPIRFDSLEYDPGSPVLGVTGPLPDVPVTDQQTFYWRGMKDAAGDEWHTLAVGDDDQHVEGPKKPKNYGDYSSDGKIYTFVVDPRTPALSVVRKSVRAQYYTTPPKQYFVPVIRAQTTYVSGDCDIELAALGGAAVQWRIAPEGAQATAWRVYERPLNTVADKLAPDTRYRLEYRVGADGPVRTRVVHFEPAYPSDREEHPRNLLWKDAAHLAKIKRRMSDPTAGDGLYADVYKTMLTSSFMHHRDGPYATQLMTGSRLNALNKHLLSSSFPLLVDGIGAHPGIARFVHDAMLDNFLNLDPVGGEHHHNWNSPTREINYHGYYSMTVPLSVALSYDWLITEMRSGRTPSGFTPIEDHKIRDNLAMFANLTLQRYADPYPKTIDANGFDQGMWTTAWLAATEVIALVMPDYDSDLYGTSGAPGKRSTEAAPVPRPWTPFPDHPMTWWQVCDDHDAPLPGYPDLARRSGFFGLLDENSVWHSRPGYWDNHLMGWIYYLMANVRANVDGRRFPHWEKAFELVVDGKIEFLADPREGPVRHHSVLILNENFPKIASRLRLYLTAGSPVNEKNLRNSLWTHGAIGLCLYDSDSGR